MANPLFAIVRLFTKRAYQERTRSDLELSIQFVDIHIAGPTFFGNNQGTAKTWIFKKLFL